MCGIVGIYGGDSAELGQRMLARLEHRGPDGQGTHQFDNAWLGHRRLSIVDLCGGDQPLSEETGHYLVGNGEIYSHDLPQGTSRWRTRSDNEALLHATIAHGGQGLTKLEGMYAFTLTGSRHPFLAARDPVGIKPLYWAHVDGKTIFASEMKAFDEAHRPYVEPFPPGHYWTPGQGLVRFADPAPEHTVDAPGDVDDHIETIRTHLIASVEMQLMADVPVGVLLSGGLDSSLVAAIAARRYQQTGRRLTTFSIGTANSGDLLAARRVAQHLNAEHYERIYTAEEAIAAVPQVIRATEHYDPALIHSSVANYLLSELASRHVKVVLTGEGADELFAGYKYLERFPDQLALDNELRRTIRTLNTLNLQRCDRTTMAFGLEARVPFLDTDMIKAAMTIPIALRHPTYGPQEKALLRAAFDGWLPPDLLWRKKAQFGDGSGVGPILRHQMVASVSDAIVEEANSGGVNIRNAEELAYYRIWESMYSGIRPQTLDQSSTL